MAGRWRRTHHNVFVERLWRSLKYEEVHLKAYANGLKARIGIGQPAAPDLGHPVGSISAETLNP